MKKNTILAAIVIILIVSMIGCTSQQVKVRPNDTNNNKEPISSTTDIPQNTQTTTALQSTTTVSTIKPEGAKADSFYIEEVVSNYESLLVDAINNNDFSLIENLLVSNSNLYNSQKKLVSDLYIENIKEKLIDFNIESIQDTGKDGLFNVYVSESIGIKYPDKQDFETKKYNWIYTVVEGKDSSIGLSEIEKWTNEEIVDNSYFFTSNILQMNYKGKFLFNDIVEQDVKLNINELANLKKGKLYELMLESIEGVPNDRLSLGYFYVQKDKIYKIEPTEANISKLKTSERLPDGSVIVCQDNEMKDKLGKDEPGFHHYLEVDGNKREYHSYNNKVSTGYYESFIWEKGKGLINYRSGFGAERDSIKLQLHTQ